MEATKRCSSSASEFKIKGPWSMEEDRILTRLVEAHGPRNWALISRFIKGRSGKSCRLRWCNQLSPAVEHRPFSTREDEVILHAHAKFGNKWATIARLLPGRTDNMVKNHWNATLNRRFSKRRRFTGDRVMSLRFPEEDALTLLTLAPPCCGGGEERHGVSPAGFSDVREYISSDNLGSNEKLSKYY